MTDSTNFLSKVCRMWCVYIAGVAAVSVVVGGVVWCLPCKLTLSLGAHTKRA